MKSLKNLKETISRIVTSNQFNKINNYELYYNNLKGKKGLEIGGPTPIFEKNDAIPIYHILGNLDGCNVSEDTIWYGKTKKGMYFRYNDRKRTGYQFICDAVDLSEIESKSYEFILASHVIEHVANPFKAISEWLRVLKDNGKLLLIIPHKDNTFDHKRPLTTLEHLIQDYENDVDEKDLSHLPEILELHDLDLDPFAGGLESFRKKAKYNYERCLHHHVFDTKLALEVFNYFDIKIITSECLLPHHIVLLGEKK